MYIKEAVALRTKDIFNKIATIIVKFTVWLKIIWILFNNIQLNWIFPKGINVQISNHCSQSFTNNCSDTTHWWYEIDCLCPFVLDKQLVKFIILYFVYFVIFIGGEGLLEMSHFIQTTQIFIYYIIKTSKFWWTFKKLPSLLISKEKIWILRWLGYYFELNNCINSLRPSNAYMRP